MSRSKATGTSAETAVVNFLRKNGVPHAERRALHGSLDQGDITGWPGVCVEVKGGKAAECASDGQVEKWLIETELERKNANADYGILVLKRKGIGTPNAGDWWAVMPGNIYAGLVYPLDAVIYRDLPPTGPYGPVRTYLSHAVTLLRWAGYGNPL